MELSSLFFTTHRNHFVLILLTGILIALIFPSCSTMKESIYFKTLSKDTTLKNFVTNDFESKIQKKDVLTITVSSLSRDMDDRFNNAASIVTVGVTESKPIGYFVNEQGKVLVHFLGEVFVEGLTRRQLREKLQKDLSPYMKEPIISVQYANHKVTVLGDVAKPQVLNMPEEQQPIIDILVSSGDIKETGNKKDIMIIRETGDQKEVKHINLENNSIFSSPWYYVQPNDIVYVLPDFEKARKLEKKANTAVILSVITTGISVFAIILNIILRN